MTTRSPQVFIAEGLQFPEGLRWHRGELWFSDFYRRQVISADAAGKLTVRAYVGGQPSGLGFRPDGTPLVASVYDRNVLALTPDKADHPLTLFGSPGQVVAGPTNDMAVDKLGRAYVTGFGYEAMYEPFDANHTTRIVMIDVDGRASLQGDPLHMPNGIAFSPDERLLIVSETTRNRLTAFDVSPTGTLSNGRLFASLGAYSPDGLAVDAEGAVWVACWHDGVLLRVRDGGEICEKVVVTTQGTQGHWVPACALGGPDGKTLYYTLADTDIARSKRGESRAVIMQMGVDVPAPAAGGHA